MEMFLWFYSYDIRFLCRIKLPISILMALWIISIIIDSFLSFLYFIFIIKYKNSKCVSDYNEIFDKEIISAQLIFSILTLISSCIFAHKLYNSYKQEINSKNIYGKIVKIYTYEDYYYSFYNEPVKSINGTILFFISFLHFVFFFFFIKNRHICNGEVDAFYFWNMVYQIVPFGIIICVFVISFIIKFIFFISSYACPGCVRISSKMCSDNNKLPKINFDSEFNQTLEEV